MTTGSHILKIKKRITAGPVLFGGTCSCGSWQYLRTTTKREEVRDAHRAHLDAAVASETEASDAR